MRSPTCPTSIDRTCPSARIRAASSRSRGTPNIRGMFMTLPSGRIPSAVRAPDQLSPDQPDRPVATGRDDHVVAAVDGVPGRLGRLLLGPRFDQFVAQTVAMQQLEQHLAGRTVRRDTALASGRGIPEDPDPSLVRPRTFRGHASTRRDLRRR